MKTARYLALLFAFAPSFSFAQLDSVHVAVEGVQYPSYVISDATVPDTLGPLPLILAEPLIGCVEGGCENPDVYGFCPAIDNPDEVAGNIVLIYRGSCQFATKVRGASEAGAAAVIIANDVSQPPDRICPIVQSPPGCALVQSTDVPVLRVSFNSGQALGGELANGPTDATLLPIRVFIPPTSGTLDTGVVWTTFYDNGFVGYTPGVTSHSGFAFNGEQGLFVSTVLIGVDGVVVSNPFAGTSEYTTLEPVTALAAPLPAPFGDFDQGFTTRFSADTLGVTVTMYAYARDGDPFVVFDLVLENTLGANLNDVYTGLFADFDAGDYMQNLGGFDEGTNLLYVYDASDPSLSYFGLSALGVPDVSGWTLATDPKVTDPSLFEALTTDGIMLNEPQDARTVVGVGPFDLAPEESARARFALVAGMDEEAILANAAAAQNVVAVAVEGTDTPTESHLDVYPNPLAYNAVVAIAVAEPGNTRVVVYDILGRRVAVLHEGRLAAGRHEIVFDRRHLPSGIYLVRAETGRHHFTERVAVLH